MKRTASVTLSMNPTICCAPAAQCQIAALVSLEMNAGLRQTITSSSQTRIDIGTVGSSVFSSLEVNRHLGFGRHLSLQLHHVGAITHEPERGMICGP
jgi:hypothetical protein